MELRARPARKETLVRRVRQVQLVLKEDQDPMGCLVKLDLSEKPARMEKREILEPLGCQVEMVRQGCGEPLESLVPSDHLDRLGQGVTQVGVVREVGKDRVVNGVNLEKMAQREFQDHLENRDHPDQAVTKETAERLVVLVLKEHKVAEGLKANLDLRDHKDPKVLQEVVDLTVLRENLEKKALLEKMDPLESMEGMACLVSLELRVKKGEWVLQARLALKVHREVKERRVIPACKEEWVTQALMEKREISALLVVTGLMEPLAFREPKVPKESQVHQAQTVSRE